MAQDHNYVSLIGRMGRDIETRFLTDGKPVGNFSLAVRGYKQDETHWVRCVIYGKGAEILSQYTSKGSQLFIDGRLSVRSYEKDGQKREVVEVVVNNFQFLGKPQDAKRPVSESDGYKYPQAPTGEDDSSIPF